MDAYVLVQTQVGQAQEATYQIGRLRGVTYAETITGPYDIVVRVSGEDLISLNATVVTAIHGVESVTRTVTCPVVTQPALALASV